MIIMSGPCVIESREVLEQIAEQLKPLNENPKIDFYFKASFDKANRTSLESYRGPGLEKGLIELENIKKKFGYKIITDIHECYQCEIAAEVCDSIQIPAFLCRQTDLIVAAAKTKAKINIKKGQFMSPEGIKYSILKALKTRDPSAKSANFKQCEENGIFITERGNSFGYGNLVVDMRGLAIMREFAPTIFDCTHAVQFPSASDGKSSGDSRFAPILARAAAAVGIDGLFAECHIAPQNALSDGPNMLTIEQILNLSKVLLEISELNAKFNI